MKKTTSSLLASILCLTLAGCSTGGSAGTEPSGEPESDKISVGIVQLVAHPALDEATRGFREVLEAEFGDGIEIHYQEAAGDSTTCVTIASTFVNEKVDLIMANATPALQAAASATNEIPILGACRRFRNLEIPINGACRRFRNLEIPFLIIPPFFHSSVFPSSPTPSNLPIKKERQNKSAAPSRLWKNKTRE